MIYSLIITGFDPTSLPDTPTNAELLQMISQAQYASDIGGIILSDTEPDSTTYPILLRFRWSKTDGSGGLTGEFYYHDGTSWTLEVPGPGTVTAASLAAGTITLDKLYPGGSPFWIIRRNSIAEGNPGAGFEMISITNAISSNSLSLLKLINASSADRMIVSGPGGAWTDTPADEAFTVLFQSANGVTAFTNLSDEIFFKRISDDAPCSLTLQNFFTSGIGFLATVVTTQNSDVVTILDASDSLIAKTVLIGNLLPDTGVTAATYANPSSVSVNAKGQITAISSGASQGTRTSATIEAIERTLPTVAGSAGQLQVAHGLGSIPVIWGMRLLCKTADGAFSPGAVLDYRDVLIDPSGSDLNFPYQIRPDSTNLTVTSPNPGSRWVIRSDTGLEQTFTPANWVGLLWAST